MIAVHEIADWMGAFAPLDLAADWDNVGLLLGDRKDTIERVMTCLTVTQCVVEEAIAEKVNLIVVHHPVLFRGAKKLTNADSDGKLLLPLLRHSVAVYSPHTAFDNCRGGINDGLATRLGLENVRALRDHDGSRECKLVVFVPDADLASVSDALFANGAGIIGEYEQCSYRTPGTGTFFGRASTKPSVGERGRREEVAEWRLEVIVPESRLAAAIAAMTAAHSYEEPAYDSYALKPKSKGGSGRLGELATPRSLTDVAGSLKESLRAKVMQVTGDGSKPIRRIAVACGAAGEFLNDAIRARADAFVTGEIRFHDALAAEAAGIALMVPGHYASERPAVEDLAQALQQAFPAVRVFASRRERDPLLAVN